MRIPYPGDRDPDRPRRRRRGCPRLLVARPAPHLHLGRVRRGARPRGDSIDTAAHRDYGRGLERAEGGSDVLDDFKRALARVQRDYGFYIGCQTNPGLRSPATT